MDNQPETNSEVVEISFETPVQLRTEFYGFHATKPGEILGAKVSFQILSKDGTAEDGLELAIELAEKIHGVVVGNFGLASTVDKKEFLRTNLGGVIDSMEVS